MQQKECMIIRELLPNYIEQLTNETTGEVIEQHLKECRSCRKVYQELLREHEKQQKAAKGKDRKFRRRLLGYLIGGIVGIVLGVLTLGTLGVWFLGLVVYGPPATETSDYREYQQIFEDKIHSGLLVFPEELPESMTDIEFSYYYRDTFDDPTVSIFLQGNYDEADYEAEVARLEETKKIYGGTVRDLLKDEAKRYPYPAYVAIEDDSCSYEYALLTGESQITYIYISWIDLEDMKFDTKYLPDNYMPEEAKTFGGGYSIYLEQGDESFRNYDYTRNKNVDVSYAHVVQIGESYFRVSVELDEQDREIITGCDFFYIESLEKIREEKDPFAVEKATVAWADLNGYEFREVKLNGDGTGVVVTYLEDGQEKEWQKAMKPYMTGE